MSKQKEFQKRLKALMAKPENQICSDCPDPKPTWASIIVPVEGSSDDKGPMGAFCCYQCSGAHRRLGVHISFVRSITLDDWKEKEVIAMENGGNAKVNAVYEGGDAFSMSLKPEKGASLDAREKFIRDKYEHRKYFNKGGYAKFDASLILQRLRTRRKSASSAVDLAEPEESFEDFEEDHNERDSALLFDLLVESRTGRNDPAQSEVRSETLPNTRGRRTSLTSERNLSESTESFHGSFENLFTNTERRPASLSDSLVASRMNDNACGNDTFGDDPFGFQFNDTIRDDKSTSGFSNAGSIDSQESLERKYINNDRPNGNENREARAKGGRRKPRKVGGNMHHSMPDIAIANTNEEPRQEIQKKLSSKLPRGVQRHYSADDRTFMSEPVEQRRILHRRGSDGAGVKHSRSSPNIIRSNTRRLAKSMPSTLGLGKDERDRTEKEKKCDAKSQLSQSETGRDDLLKKFQESEGRNDDLNMMEKTGLKENKQAAGSDSSDSSNSSEHISQDLDSVHHNRQERDRPQRSYSYDETYAACKAAAVKPARLGLKRSEGGRFTRDVNGMDIPEGGRFTRNVNGMDMRKQKSHSKERHRSKDRARSVERLPRYHSTGAREGRPTRKERSVSQERLEKPHRKERARSTERLPRYNSTSKRNDRSNSSDRLDRKDTRLARSRSVEKLHKSQSSINDERSQSKERLGGKERRDTRQKEPRRGSYDGQVRPHRGRSNDSRELQVEAGRQRIPRQRSLDLDRMPGRHSNEEDRMVPRTRDRRSRSPKPRKQAPTKGWHMKKSDNQYSLDYAIKYGHHHASGHRSTNSETDATENSTVSA